MRWLTLAVGLLLTLAQATAFAEKTETILEQSTESESLPNSIIPEQAMIQAILSSYKADDQMMYGRMLKKCMIDKKVSLRKLFRATPLPKIGAEDTVYFVRPSAEPFCLAFYGAHNFQFWLVNQNNKVLYFGGADAVTVLKTHHNGMYDIEVEHGGGWGTLQTKMKFDGHKYKPVVCNKTTVDKNEREVTKRVSCS